MAKNGGAFERDRKQFRKLLREIDVRLDEAAGESAQLGVGPLLRKIEYLELPARFGFGGLPLEQLPEPAVSNSLADVAKRFGVELATRPAKREEERFRWCDPLGTKSGEVTVPYGLTLLESIGREPRKHPLKVLRSAIARWQRAIVDLESRSIYPALPSWFDVALDRNLVRDPLWRCLHQLEGMCQSGANSGAFSTPTDGELQRLLNQINALATYEGLCDGGICIGYYEDDLTRSGFELQLASPRRQATLKFDANGALGADDVKVLHAAVADWRSQRAKDLTRRDSAARPSRRPQSLKGSSAKQAQAMQEREDQRTKDRKIHEAWDSGKHLTKADLGAAFHIDALSATRALDRERKRRERTK